MSAASTLPTVTILIRSMGRPELRRALVSVASQDHRAIDVVVIDATGGRHPALPELDLPAGMSVRLVPGDRPLSRPEAANRGLDEVRGDWFGFLDDDDEFEPGHVSRLLDEGSRTVNLIVYGATRFLDVEGRQKSVLSRPFSPALLPHGVILTFPAALIRRQALLLGCRFDERLPVCEDRDFFMQVSQHSAFTFVDVPTVRYHTEAGTSGLGEGANRNPVRARRYAEQVLAKWHAEAWYPYLAAQRECWRALGVAAAGDVRGAEALLLKTLERYPDDPNVLSSLGDVRARLGDLAAAESWVRRAVAISPSSGEYRMMLAGVLMRRGNPSAAAEELWVAASDPRHADAARRALTALGSQRPGAAPPSSRIASDEARLAKGDSHVSEALHSKSLELAAAGDFEGALDCLERAWDAGADTERVLESAQPLLLRAFEAEKSRSVAVFLARRLHLHDPGESKSPGPLHVLSQFGAQGAAAEWALGLARLWGRGQSLTLWSVGEPLPRYREEFAIEQVRMSVGIFPRGGHLVLVGHDYPVGAWVEEAQPAKVTLGVSSEDMTPLLARLVEFEAVIGSCRFAIAYRSDAIRSRAALGGEVLATS